MDGGHGSFNILGDAFIDPVCAWSLPPFVMISVSSRQCACASILYEEMSEFFLPPMIHSQSKAERNRQKQMREKAKRQSECDPSLVL